MVFMTDVLKIALIAVLIFVISLLGIATITNYQKAQKEIALLKSKITQQEQVIDKLTASIQMLSSASIKPTGTAVVANYKYYFNIPAFRLLTAQVTAYVPSAGGINCAGDCNNTSRSFKVSAVDNQFSTLRGITYCAVDPNVIPFYSLIIIQGLDRPCIAVDTGSKIKGHHIDVLFTNYDEALKWGSKNVKVIVIPPSVLKQIEITDTSTN